MPGGFGSLLQAAAITAVLCVLLVLFLRTQLGLSLRATGDNRDMVSASSINPAFTTTVGLCLSNAVVALSGALIAQYQKFADNTLGTGMVVIGCQPDHRRGAVRPRRAPRAGKRRGWRQLWALWYTASSWRRPSR